MWREEITQKGKFLLFLLYFISPVSSFPRKVIKPGLNFWKAGNYISIKNSTQLLSLNLNLSSFGDRALKKAIMAIF